MSEERHSCSWADKLNTEQLEWMIRSCLDAPEDEDTDTDLIIYISELMRARAERDGEDTPPDTERAWERFNELYLPLAENGEALYGGSDDEDGETPARNDREVSAPRCRRRKAMGVLSKAACIVLALVVLTFAGAGVASAAGYNVWDVIITLTDETLTFRRTGGDVPQELPTGGVEGMNVYASLQEALDAYGITVPLAPRWIPEDYALTELSVGSAGGAFLTFCAAYKTDSEGISVGVVFNAGDSIGVVEKDAGDVETYKKGGVTHYIMTNRGDTVASWANGPYECWIDGSDLSVNDLKRMIDSIYEQR